MQTAPAATQTRQNKASSDSSVSGTAVGPEIRKETAINPTALGYTGSGGDTEQTHTREETHKKGNESSSLLPKRYMDGCPEPVTRRTVN